MVEKKKSSGKARKARIHITGMTCTTCAATVEKGLSKTAGVEQARVNFAAEKASVEYDPARVDLSRLRQTVAELGYGVATK